MVELYKAICHHRNLNIDFCAFCGEEGLNEYRKLNKCPKLIIMDYMLPDINGIETTKQLLDLNPDLKILFISAYDSIKEDALKVGAVFFLKKPFVLEDFEKAISNHL